jgi:hypothetical protein
MTQDDAAPAEKRRRKRRLWPRWLKRRVVLVLLIVLGVVGWRYGWPTRSLETTVCPLEEIDWQTAARLAPQCIGSAWGARNVLLVEGSLDEEKKPAFDLRNMRYSDSEFVRVRRDILRELVLPDLSGRRFRAGVFWVDTPSGDGDTPAQPYHPAMAYSVLLMCDPSQRYEDAAELVIDVNRNRDLTDDPVVMLSDMWSDEDENTRAKLNWFVRVFEPVTLSRIAHGQVGGEALPATVRSVPTLTVTYYTGEREPDRLGLAFSPTSYRTGRITSSGVTQDVVIAPDSTRLGRFDGPAPSSWNIGDDRIYRYPLTAWAYERGTFWGCTLDANARDLRDGPYHGSTGALRAETAGGESLRIGRFSLWLRGEDPHLITSEGWAPIPRFSSLRLAHYKQPLPVGDYGVERLTLVRGLNSSVVIEGKGQGMALSAREFSIKEGLSTVYRLPKVLKLTAYAAIEARPRPYTIQQVWSTASDISTNEMKEWKGPQPGSKIQIGVSMSDSATGITYSIYQRANPPLKLVIQDESGNTVHQGTMDYG